MELKLGLANGYQEYIGLLIVPYGIETKILLECSFAWCSFNRTLWN